MTHLRNERDHPRLVMKVEFWAKSQLPAPLGYQVGRWSPVVTRGVWHISGSPDHSFSIFLVQLVGNIFLIC